MTPQNMNEWEKRQNNRILRIPVLGDSTEAQSISVHESVCPHVCERMPVAMNACVCVHVCTRVFV